jgi:hypothetical protein
MVSADLQPAAEATPVFVTNPSVVLICTDAHFRRGLTDACRSAGVSILAVGSIAEIERWPVGSIVVTDLPYLTPWWKTVGAMHVLALADDVDAGVEALRRGASGWLLREHSHAAVAALALTVATTSDYAALDATTKERESAF